MKDFITLLNYSHDQLEAILDEADRLYVQWQANDVPPVLRGARVGMLFAQGGFRNRVAFELGVQAMGGHVVFVSHETASGEPVEDVARYLANWCTLLVVRLYDQPQLAQLAASLEVPVINARTSQGHPCEIMGDLQYIRRQRGSLDGLRVVYAGSVTNICQSWFEAAARWPISVTQVAPEAYLAEAATLRDLNADALGSIETTPDLNGALTGADVLVTDTWPRTLNRQEHPKIVRAFTPFQITPAHLARMPKGAFFLPCPPVERGREVSAEAMQSPMCQSYAAKNFLMHVQNAIMKLLTEDALTA